MSRSCSSVGRMPSSVSLLAFTSTMNRILGSLSSWSSGLCCTQLGVDWGEEKSTRVNPIVVGLLRGYTRRERLCNGRQSNVQEHQDPCQLRAGSDRRRGSSVGAAICAEAQRRDPPLARQ